MISGIFGGSSDRSRLKVAVPALVLAAALGLGQTSAWARPNPREGAELTMAKLEAAAGSALKIQGPAESADNSKHQALFEALDQWMSQNKAAYNYDIPKLGDPFLPIEEFRGGLNKEREPSAFTQMKLVAIIMANNGSDILASFEDGAGQSHILRQGDHFGDTDERVVKITSSAVTVEEPGQSPGEEARITEIRLSLPDLSTGVTRSGE